ncbi:MAG: oxidoreductase [Bacteroidetes bacterium]|nr:MAG: oxidoreductase [Bacteroidota bacterium]
MKISKDKKTALVFGATGLVGGFLTDFLLMHGAYEKVIAFGRRELDIEHPKLIQHVINFENPEEFNDLVRGDDLFCCLGTTLAKAGSKEGFFKVDFIYSYRVAKIAAANKVNQFLLISSVGADKDSLFYYSRVKGQIEEAVRGLDFWATHIFRPSVLLGERPENRWGESVAGRIGKFLDGISGGLLTKYRPIEADVVAKAMVNAAQELKPGVHVYPSDFLQGLAEKETENFIE